MLLYPYEQVKVQEFVVSANFITMKNLSGQNMKANYGYPFPVIVNKANTLGHFLIGLIRKLNLTKENETLILIQIE